MRRRSKESDYFVWLCEMVCVDGRYTDESYWVLAEALWCTDYYWTIPLDRNRANNSSILRFRYSKLEGGEDPYDGPPTVLEVFVMLAEDMFNLLDELDGEDRRPMFFWEMIDNLGLTSFTDQLFRDYPEKKELYLRRIQKKLDIWMHREYDYNGTGGLFPLRDPRSDQTKIELWYQMQSYISENYY